MEVPAGDFQTGGLGFFLFRTSHSVNSRLHKKSLAKAWGRWYIITRQVSRGRKALAYTGRGALPSGVLEES